MNTLVLNIKKINLTVLALVFALLGYYLYQAVFISSGSVRAVSLKKEFLERKNNLSAVLNEVKKRESLDLVLIKDNLKMAEVESFDYLILGPSEFVVRDEKFESRQ